LFSLVLASFKYMGSYYLKPLTFAHVLK
jgi:hypothetical protein